jgi:putative two-component system response regulator
MSRKVLFVDDEARVLNGLRRLLSDRTDDWELLFANSVDEALEVLRSGGIDTVVSDIQMPGKDGFVLLKTVRQMDGVRDVPIVILTGGAQTDLKRRALDLGATDLLTKPVESDDLVARLRNTLQLKAYQDELKDMNRVLEQRVMERTRQLKASRLDMVLRLAKVAELHDRDTGDHIARVGSYCRATAEALDLDPDFIELVFVASPLHDIGKMGIPDSILNKPGRLTPEERIVMNTHCDIGYEILKDRSPVGLNMLTGDLDFQETLGNPLIEMAASIALTHHEKWDGSGYPRGLQGEEIPLAGRIVAVADVFDALCSRRSYKSAYAAAEAMDIMKDGVGSHFDPAVYAGFLQALDKLPDRSSWYVTGEDEALPRAA